MVMRAPAEAHRSLNTRCGQDMRIRDVMAPALCVSYEDRAELTLQRMQTAGIEHSIVVRQNKLVGVVSQQQLQFEPGGTPTGEIATAVAALAPDDLLKDAASLMRKHRVACIPVVEDGTIEGVVTTDRLLELIDRGIIQPVTRRNRHRGS